MSTWDLAALSAVKQIVNEARTSIKEPSVDLLRGRMDALIDTRWEKPDDVESLFYHGGLLRRLIEENT